MNKARINKPALTARETEVMDLLKTGISTQRIADKLFIAYPTVRNHIYSIKEKLGAHTKLQAVLIILEREKHGLA